MLSADCQLSAGLGHGVASKACKGLNIIFVAGDKSFLGLDILTQVSP